MDTQEKPAEFRIEVDGRTIVARPRPEDQATFEELLSRGQNATMRLSTADTEGHVLAADELGIDVEGHAMTLRLPSAADAAALRRALAVTALTATFAVGGFAAGSYVESQTQASTGRAPAVTTQWVAPFDAPEAAPAPAPRIAPFDAPEAAPGWVAPFDAPDATGPTTTQDAPKGGTTAPVHPRGPGVE